MKIFVNARFLTQPITGVQRFAIEICLQLKKILGEEIVFVSPKGIVQHEYAQMLEVKEIGCKNGYFWEQLELPMYLKKNGNPLLLCLCNLAPLLYKNKVVVVHDVAFEAFPQTFSKSFLFVYQFLIPRIIKSSKHVITVSEFSKSELIKYYKLAEDKVSVVYNSVSSSFMPSNNKVDEKYFLAVSSMNYRKNFLFILNAYEKFINEGGSGCLYIIGDIKNKSFAQIDMTKYSNNPNIKFLGRVSDSELIDYYSNAFAFIYPSLYEGFGIPPLEAQACGCPAICSSASCLPEVFDDTVLYCDPYKEESLVNVMRQLDSVAVRNSLIEKGRKNIDKYSWIKSAEKLQKILVKYTS